MQAQVARLQRENEILRRTLDQIKRSLQVARAACVQYIAQARAVLGNKSGVPRGEWAYARGGNTVAVYLYAILSRGEG